MAAAIPSRSRSRIGNASRSRTTCRAGTRSDDWRLDVTGKVDVTDAGSVKRAVLELVRRHYPGADTSALEQAFDDVGRLFRGELPGYRACDTPYHDLRHSLDTALAMARLTDGHEAQCHNDHCLGPDWMALGVSCALFHDAGYIRSSHDTRVDNGARYTPVHVRRSARFMGRWLARYGLGAWIPAARRIILCTEHDRTPREHGLREGRELLLGTMLAAADLMAQTSDRRYLEKARDRLYPEFRLAGMDRRLDDEGTEVLLYGSGQELLERTPGFFRFVEHRLHDHLGGVHRYAAASFGGSDPYAAAMARNRQRLDAHLAGRPLDTLG